MPPSLTFSSRKPEALRPAPVCMEPTPPDNRLFTMPAGRKESRQMQKKDQTTQELFSIITEPSTIQGIKETLKLCMDSLKENTLNTLLTQDADYQTALLEYRQAHQRYQDTDFTESQREVIDTLLARKDESEFEHTANAYMAGLLDSYRILRNFGLTLE